MERDQNNHIDNMHDDKIDHKMGRDFRNLGSHTGIVHLHSGIEHLNNVDVEVKFLFTYFLISILSHILFVLHIFTYIQYFLGKISERCSWFFRFGSITRIMCSLWR